MLPPRFKRATQSFKHMPSYRRYLNADPMTGRKERPDHLMPRLQYNASGQLMLVPGEVFCRWRNDDGTFCKRVTALCSTMALERHYDGKHGSGVEKRQAHNTNEWFRTINNWYRAVVDGEMPRWLPRIPAHGTVYFETYYVWMAKEESDDGAKAEEGGSGQGNT